jgi:hypothetical protein
MARTIIEIQNEIIAELDNNGITVSSSLTSRRRIWTWVVAFCILTMEKLFDYFRAETDDKIKKLKPATLTWFAEKIKTFQFGDNLVPETDYYDNTGLTPAQIEDKKVIKYAAAVEQSFSNGRFGVRIKAAGVDGSGVLVKMPDDQRDAAREFLSRIKPAGTYCELTTDDADYLKLSLKVYYNPLVMDGTGSRLDGTNPIPIREAIDRHLKNLPFNGRFNLTSLVDAMQAVDGVLDPRIISAQTKYADTAYTEVIDERIPNAGYLKIYADADITIQWIAKSAA